MKKDRNIGEDAEGDEQQDCPFKQFQAIFESLVYIPALRQPSDGFDAVLVDKPEKGFGETSRLRLRQTHRNKILPISLEFRS
jgi:hypothetical protein